MTAQERLADEVTQLVRALQEETDPDAVLQRVVDAAVVEVPGADWAGVTVLARDGARTPACSAELVSRLDEWQYSSGEGPCLEAAGHRHVVRSDDLASEARWPGFTPRAVEFGVASMVSFSMFVEASTTVGALNLYGSAADVFTEDDVQLGGLLAAHAGIVMVAKRTEAQLRTALDSRDVIGQAKGRLMERYGLTAEQAFDRLIAGSQAANMKLRDVAAKVADPGGLELPGSRTGSPGG